jgi:hypothetical protein
MAMSVSSSQAVLDAAERLGIQALGFLAADPARLAGFLAASGYHPAEIRARAGSAEFLAGVLDHLLGDESLLLVFTSEAGIDPKHVASARRTLARDRDYEA